MSRTCGIGRVPGFTRGTVNLYQVTSGWKEGTVTYATHPGKQASPLSSLTVTTPNIFVEFVVTGAVQSWITNSSGNFGVELLVSGAMDVAFDSKEGTGTSHPAMLEIALTRPAAPQGAQGPQGPAALNRDFRYQLTPVG